LVIVESSFQEAEQTNVKFFLDKGLRAVVSTVASSGTSPESAGTKSGAHGGTPLWFSGQSSWLQIQRSEFDSRRYQSFWEVVGLERSPISLVSTIEELLERNSSGSGLENREYGRRDSSR
jgi:hypothetical protein